MYGDIYLPAIELGPSPSVTHHQIGKRYGVAITASQKPGDYVIRTLGFNGGPVGLGAPERRRLGEMYAWVSHH